MQSLLPVQFLHEFYKVLLTVKPKFLTCDDLDFSFLNTPPTSPTQLSSAYAKEFGQWHDKPRPLCPHIMILHDADSGPAATLELCALERTMGIVSTVSTYARWAWLPRGICEYDIDFSTLVELQQAGFGVTYHCNAASQVYHSGSRNIEEVFERYDDDVEALRAKGLKINYYAAHGESRLPREWRNVSFFYPANVRHPLISTHSGYGFQSHAFYDDGGIFSELQGREGDVRRFLRNNVQLFKKNARIHILIHPQNYCAKDKTFAQEYFHTHPWAKEYWDLYEKDMTHEYWKDCIRTMIRGI